MSRANSLAPMTIGAPRPLHMCTVRHNECCLPVDMERVDTTASGASPHIEEGVQVTD
jgi:hypothetical protein